MNLDAFTRAMVAALIHSLDTDDPPRLPAGGDLLWSWFCDLASTRSMHMAGPNPIANTEIAAYCAMMRVPMRPPHVAILKAMDRAFLDHAARARPGEPDSAQKATAISTRPMTAALFDALFG